MSKVFSGLFVVGVILAGIAWLASPEVQVNQSQSALQYAEAAVSQSEAQVNQSRAALQNAQAAQIAQAIRRQNEADDGIAVNVGARVLTGRGITDAQQFTSSVLWSLCGLPILMAMAVLVGVMVLKPHRT